MALRKADKENAIREGWIRDEENEVYIDGYNALVQVTTNDGTSGLELQNLAGGTAFRAKSDGDGYVAQNLGVGTLNPTEKLDVAGTAKVLGFQLSTGAVDGYVLTSDGSGVGSWQVAGAAQATQYFEAYDNTGGTSIDSGWTDVPLDTERIEDSAFTHTGSSAEVTINESGTYLIIGRVTIEQTGGNNRSDAEIRLMLDAGTGFSEVDGSKSTIYSRNNSNGTGTAVSSVVLTLNTGDIVKVQAQRLSGSGNLELRADGSSLVIVSPKGEKGDKGDAGTGSTIIVEDDGVTVTGGPHDTLNFTEHVGATDAGGGTADIALDFRTRTLFFDDFYSINAIDLYDYSVSGGGSIVENVDDGHGGQMIVQAGGSNGNSGFFSVGNETVSMDQNAHLIIRAKINTSTSNMYAEIGLQDNDNNDRIQFIIDGGSNWDTSTEDGSSTTQNDSGVAFDTDWHIFEIITTSSSAEFKIDGSIVDTITTNLPTNDVMTVNVFVLKTSDSGGNRSITFDFIHLESDRAS